MGRKKRDTYVSRFLSQILVAEAVEILAAAEDVGEGKTLMKQSIPLSRMNSRNWTYSRELQTQSSWILSAWE